MMASTSYILRGCCIVCSFQNTLRWIFKQQSTGWYVDLLGHIILIPSQINPFEDMCPVMGLKRGICQKSECIGTKLPTTSSVCTRVLAKGFFITIYVTKTNFFSNFYQTVQFIWVTGDFFLIRIREEKISIKWNGNNYPVKDFFQIWRHRTWLLINIILYNLYLFNFYRKLRLLLCRDANNNKEYK